MTEEMVRLDRLAKRFGPVHAVEDVSFGLVRGEVLGFLGPNGAGKSTTMRMLTGFIPPTSGTASVMGFDVVERPIEAKRRLGYLPEGAPLYGDMTPAGFLRFVAAMRGIGREERAPRVDALLRTVPGVRAVETGARVNGTATLIAVPEAGSAIARPIEELVERE